MKPFALQPNIAAPNYPVGVCCLGIPDAWNAANSVSVEAPSVDAKTHQEKTPAFCLPVIFRGPCLLACPQGRFAHGCLLFFFFFLQRKMPKQICSWAVEEWLGSMGETGLFQITPLHH